MKKVVFITPLDAEFGFKLGGVPQIAIEAAGAEDALKQVMSGTETGLVIIDERLLSGMTEERLRGLEHGWPGILLVMPSPLKPPPEVEDYAARLIRRAIGYHVRLKV